MVKYFRSFSDLRISAGISLVLFVLVIAPISSKTVGPGELFTNPVTAQGDVVVLTGRLMNLDGQPISGGEIEIWQTDERGIYNHPGDSDRENRDRGFQFFGTSTTDDSGRYAFRTILPGRYEPRPRHIHVRIRMNRRTVLISQLYFRTSDDPFRIGSVPDELLVGLTPAGNIEDSKAFNATFDFTVSAGGGSGMNRPTPSQGEGPYYPMEEVSLFDSDLAAVP
jgi:protocatechuate 3,4-dioxygenase beta subunit